MRILFFGRLRRVVGEDCTVQNNIETVEELIQALACQLGKKIEAEFMNDSSLKPTIHVFVDGVNINATDRTKPLKNAQEVSILEAIAGG